MNGSAFNRATSLDQPGNNNIPSPYVINNVNRPPQYTADNTATPVDQLKPETSHTVQNNSMKLYATS